MAAFYITFRRAGRLDNLKRARVGRDGDSREFQEFGGLRDKLPPSEPP